VKQTVYSNKIESSF